MSAKIVYALAVACAAASAADAASVSGISQLAPRQAAAEATPSLVAGPADAAAAPSLLTSGTPAPTSDVPTVQYPTVTADEVLAQVQQMLQLAPAPGSGNVIANAAQASPINPNFDWQVELEKLGLAAFEAAVKDDPVALATGAGNLLINLFSGGSSSTPGKSKDEIWKEQVTAKLANVEADIGQAQKALTTLTDISTDIKMAADSEALRITLQNMISSATTINRAYAQFEHYASSVLAKDATADEALERMYTLLHNSETPSAVHNALLEYQTMVLGSSAGSAVGLLSQMPNIIKGAWEDCAQNIASPGWTAAGINGTRPAPYEWSHDWPWYHQYVADPDGSNKVAPHGWTKPAGHEDWIDGVRNIFDRCNVYAHTQMVDREGFSVQSIFASILATQLKAYSFLRVAYNDDPLEARGLQDVEQMTVAIGKQLAALYPSVTAPGLVDAFGVDFVKRHAQTLGPDRAYQAYWITFDKYGDPFSPQWWNGKPFMARPSNGLVESGYVTSMCHPEMWSLNDPTRPALEASGYFGGNTFNPWKEDNVFMAPCIVDFSKFDLSSAFFDKRTWVPIPATLIGHTRDNPSDGKEEFAYGSVRAWIETPASALSRNQMKPQWLQAIEKAYSPAPQGN